MSTNDSKKIIVKSSDKETFEVDEAVALQWQKINHMVEGCTDNGVTLPKVTAKILAMVIEYCKMHVNDSYSSHTVDEELKNWDADFVKDLKDDQETLFDLMLAANYLDIKGLLDLTCNTVADIMKDKTPDKICNAFHIVSDYTN